MIKVWYSHKHSCQFIGIPKTGSSTVRKSLDIKDENFYLTTLDSKLKLNYPCFTVIRHPYPRLVSCYNELQRMQIPRSLVSFDQFVDNTNMFGYFNWHLYPQHWFNHPQISKFYTLENGLLDFMLDFDLPELKIANTTPTNNNVLTDEIKAKIDLLYGQDLKLYYAKSVLY